MRTTGVQDIANGFAPGIYALKRLGERMVGEEKDIKLVFSDCYSLVSYNINTDLLDNYDDISALRDSIYKIIIYYYINMLGINIEDIEFFSIID